MFARLARFVPHLTLRLPNLLAWYEISRERRHLAHLTERELNDLGLTKSDVEAELRRAAWDAPNHWTR